MQSCLDCPYGILRPRNVPLSLSGLTIQNVLVPCMTLQPGQSPVNAPCISRTQTINAGSRIVIDTAATGVNPSVYTDPLAFRPGRWSDPDPAKAEATKQGFMGFAVGQRGCVWRRFAEVEILSFLVRL